MQVKVQKITHETVELDKETLDKIVLEHLRYYFDLFNAKNDYSVRVKDDQVVLTVENYGGTHSWYEDELIRKASDEDHIIDRFREILNRQMKLSDI